jgi:hypothetical protein
MNLFQIPVDKFHSVKIFLYLGNIKGDKNTYISLILWDIV